MVPRNQDSKRQKTHHPDQYFFPSGLCILHWLNLWMPHNDLPFWNVERNLLTRKDGRSSRPNLSTDLYFQRATVPRLDREYSFYHPPPYSKESTASPVGFGLRVWNCQKYLSRKKAVPQCKARLNVKSRPVRSRVFRRNAEPVRREKSRPAPSRTSLRNIAPIYLYCSHAGRDMPPSGGWQLTAKPTLSKEQWP